MPASSICGSRLMLKIIVITPPTSKNQKVSPSITTPAPEDMRNSQQLNPAMISGSMPCPTGEQTPVSSSPATAAKTCAAAPGVCQRLIAESIKPGHPALFAFTVPDIKNHRRARGLKKIEATGFSNFTAGGFAITAETGVLRRNS